MQSFCWFRLAEIVVSKPQKQKVAEFKMIYKIILNSFI